VLFNSPEYIFLFLPFVFSIYFLLNSLNLFRESKAFLVVASLGFYGYWNVLYLPLIILSMVINYYLGCLLADPDKIMKKVKRKRLLIFGVSLNLGALAYFKYTDFLIENINYLTAGHWPTLNIILPLAISFFTFQQIAYLVDSYKKETREYNVLNYAIFVCFFPQLIAGPIVHHKEMMPQFENRDNRFFDYKNIALGMFIFSIGFFKKVVIADRLSSTVAKGFDHAQVLNFLEGWVTSLSYTFQIYFDFSGYTDMAIGAALLFNIRLPINFNSPYKALDIQDFWRRWHMTLSRFLRDYIYIPLGGNRYGDLITYRNIFITFVLGGIWHGAAWTFVIWGALHGFALIVHRFWKSLGLRMPTILAWFITFQFVNVTWVFFRATSWESAFKVLKGMFGGEIVIHTKYAAWFGFLVDNGFRVGNILENLGTGIKSVLWLAPLLFIVLFFRNSHEMKKEDVIDFKGLCFSVLIFMASLYYMNEKAEFLYFNF
jgi:alginate O-acetyltransferase complex protein AlgI